MLTPVAAITRSNKLELTIHVARTETAFSDVEKHKEIENFCLEE